MQEIGTKALGKLGDINIITIAFSLSARAAKGVSSIESWLTVCYLLWFNVNTASLNLNTSCHIDFMFMDAVEVLALLVNNGLLLSHKNGYRECCQLSEVTPLQWTLDSLLAWIGGVKDQSLFEGRAHGGIGSLFKWNGMSNAGGNYQEYSSFLQVMNLLFNSIPFQRYVSGYSQMGMNHAPDQYFHGRVRKKECGGGRARTETKEHFNFPKAIERIIRRVLVLPIDNDHE